MKNSKKENSILCVMLFILSVAFVYFFSGSTSPICQGFYGDDSAVFQVVGRAWTKGLLPYVNVFDHKGPITFFIEALGFSIGNYGVMIIQCLFMWLTMFFTFKTANEFLDYKWSLGATISTFLVLATSYGTGNYTEEYSLVFIVISLYLGVKYFNNCHTSVEHPWKYAIWYGISVSCIAMMRLTSAFAICLLVFVILCKLIINKKGINILYNALGILGGMIIPIIPFIIYFAIKGALYDMFFGTIIYNISYVGESTIFARVGAPYDLTVIALFTTAMLGITSVIHLICVGREKKELGIYSFLLAAGTTYLFVKMNRYVHYYIIGMPYFVLVVGMAKQIIDQKEKKVIQKLGVFATCTMIIIQLLLGGYSTFLQIKVNADNQLYADQYNAACKQLMSHVPENEKDEVMVFGSNTMSQWYLSADIQPIFKYCFSQGWQSKCCEDMKNEIVTFLKETPTKWMVVDSDYNTERMLENYCVEYKDIVEEEYELIDTAKTEEQQKCFQLYRLK